MLKKAATLLALFLLFPFSIFEYDIKGNVIKQIKQFTRDYQNELKYFQHIRNGGGKYFHNSDNNNAVVN